MVTLTVAVPVDSTDTGDRVTRELTRALFQQGPATLGFALFCLTVCAGLLFGEVRPDALSLWYAVGVTTVILRVPLVLAAPRLPDEKLPYRSNLLLVACAGSVWGSMVLFWAPDQSQATQLVLILFPLLMSVGVIASYGPRLPLFFAFALPAQMPLLFLLGSSTDVAQLRLALPCALFVVGQAVLVKRYHHSYREMAQLKIGNERLADDLASQNRELSAARDDAESASVAKSEFLARMSHEIRTPMNGVLGTAEMLARTDLDTSQRKLLGTLSESGDQLLELIDRLLDISRVEKGDFELQAVDYAPRSLLAGLFGSQRQIAERKALALNWSVAEDVPTELHGDAARLRQIIHHLLENAIRFTASGSVVISVTCESEGNDGSTLIVRVSDTGCGIPADQLGSIFEPFRQGDGSSTRRVSGTGLGLALVREMTALMGGQVQVETELNEGSAFTIILPLVTAQHVASGTATGSSVPTGRQPLRLTDVRQPAPDIDGTGSPERAPLVLVAEDNPVNQMLIEAMLEGFGCHVHLAEDGAQALVALGEVVYDIVFMDCQMPHVDGLEATRTARTQGHVLPIVAVTANALSGDRERCLDAGMDDYMTKPFARVELADMLGRWGFPVSESLAA